jgi:transcriptional regulator with XRE-family HTH domain
MKPSDYLDLAHKKMGVRTDNKLREKLNWSSSKVNNYRHNKQMMDNEAARQIAEVLDVPVWQVIADMEINRAKDEPTRKAWMKLSKLKKEAGAVIPNLLILQGLLAVLTGNFIYYVKL